MKHPIQNINGDFIDEFGDEDLDSNSDFENEDDNDFDEQGEQDYYEATHICDSCNGLDSYCPYCGGSGTIKRKY